MKEYVASYYVRVRIAEEGLQVTGELEIDAIGIFSADGRAEALVEVCDDVINELVKRCDELSD